MATFIVPFNSLEIKQFRAFDTLTMEQLGQVNLIMGKNNVGKSTLLEALYLHANAGSPQAVRFILDRRNEPYSNEFTPEDIPPVWKLFYGAIPEPEHELAISTGQGRATTLSISTPLTDLGDDLSVAVLHIHYRDFGRDVPLDRFNRESLPRIWNAPGKMRPAWENALPCIFITSDGLSKADLPRLWEHIALTEAKSDVLEALKIIAPEIEDFAIFVRDRDVICHMRLVGEKQPIPAKVLGDGVNRILGMSMAIVGAKGGILLVDELENGLHWSVLPKVWRFLFGIAKKLNVQIFATTHSNDCLKAFQRSLHDEPEISGLAVRLERQDNGFHAEVFERERLALVVGEEIEIR